MDYGKEAKPLGDGARADAVMTRLSKAAQQTVEKRSRLETAINGNAAHSRRDLCAQQVALKLRVSVFEAFFSLVTSLS